MMNQLPTLIITIIVLIFTSIPCYGSQVKDVVIFSSYYSTDIPVSIVNQVDDGIVNFFASIPLFRVKGYQYRFSSKSLQDFMKKIEELKGKEILESVELQDPKWGSITISPSDLENLINSVIIVPNILYAYSDTRLNFELFSTEYIASARIGISLKFIDLSSGLISEVVEVKSEVKESSLQPIPTYEIIVKCVEDLMSKLKKRLKYIRSLGLTPKVVDKKNGTYLIEFGRNFEIYPYDEFEIVSFKTNLVAGKIYVKPSTYGLLRVVNSEWEYSELVPVLGEPKIGDILFDLNREKNRDVFGIGFKNINLLQPSSDTLKRLFNEIWKWKEGEYIAPYIEYKRIIEFGASEISFLSFSVVFSSPMEVGVNILDYGYSIYFKNFRVKPFLYLSLGYQITVDFSTNSYIPVEGGYHAVISLIQTLNLTPGIGVSLGMIISKGIELFLDAKYEYGFKLFDWYIGDVKDPTYDTLIEVFDSLLDPSDFIRNEMIPSVVARGLSVSGGISIRY